MARISRFSFLLTFGLLAACGRQSVGVARVGPLIITQEDFGQRITEVAPEFARYLETPMGKKQFLEILIREKLILAAAQDSKAAGSKQLQEELRELRDRQRRELKDFREHRITQLWKEGLRQKGVLGVEKEAVDQFLKDHPREIILRHILLGDPDEAHALYKRIKRGESFAALAKEHSLDAETRAKGGRLPPFLYGEVLSELSDVAFRMKTNEVNGVIRSKFGYHILKKEGSVRVSARNKAVRDRVEKLLERRQFDEFLAGLQERYPVEVYDASYR